MMNSLVLLKKKKKAQIIKDDILDNTSQYYPVPEIQKKMLKFFSMHIGENNGASMAEIFENCFGVNPEIVEPYKKFFMLTLLQKLIRYMRSKNYAFVIKKGDKYFVMRTIDECDYYKDICKRAIKGMKNSMNRAENWVDKEEWKKLIKE